MITTTRVPIERSTDDLPLDVRERQLAERRLLLLAAAVREHEREQRRLPGSIRYPDLALYRRLRQISGGA